VHADVDVALLNLDRRSVRPDFELLEVLGGGLLKGADPLAWNEEARIASGHDLNRIPLGYIAHRLSSKFRLGLRLASSECLCVLRKWGEPGGRRLTCLTDGSTLEEQVLAHAQEGKTYHFRYVVWNYTTEKARPIVYGVGDFLSTDLGDGRTHVRWTYAFELNRGRFPGYLGALGRFLFRVGFLDREYADMMRNSLAATKAGAERTPLADQK
jgi:hypothetical protein